MAKRKGTSSTPLKAQEIKIIVPNAEMIVTVVSSATDSHVKKWCSSHCIKHLSLFLNFIWGRFHAKTLTSLNSYELFKGRTEASHCLPSWAFSIPFSFNIRAFHHNLWICTRATFQFENNVMWKVTICIFVHLMYSCSSWSASDTCVKVINTFILALRNYILDQVCNICDRPNWKCSNSHLFCICRHLSKPEDAAKACWISRHW